MRLALLALLAVSSLAFGDHHAKGTSIFNGKDLTGWKIPKDNIWWSVVEGNIVAKSGPKKKGSTPIRLLAKLNSQKQVSKNIQSTFFKTISSQGLSLNLKSLTSKTPAVISPRKIKKVPKSARGIIKKA